MRLIVNTNRIIAALAKDSLSRKIINHINAELIAISFSEQEINKYKSEILRKSKMNEEEYQMLLHKLKDKMTILEDKVIEPRLNEAHEIMDPIDPFDFPFIAAALATKADIWSDDKHFEKQNKIRIWKTKDLVKFVI